MTVEEEVQTYTDRELYFWNKGYLAAIEGLLEQIQEDQIKLLNKVLKVDEDGDLSQKERLLSRLKVLDIYEGAYKKRLPQLRSKME